MVIATTMCKLFFAMVIGFYLAKKNILTKEATSKMSAMIVQITCPCLILNSISTVSHSSGGGVLKLFAAGIVMYIIFPILAIIFTKVLRVPQHLKGTYMCMFIFSNNMFMGYPVVQALFGDSAIFYMTIFNMPFNILFFTLAMHLIQKDAAMESGTYTKQKFELRKVLNNGILASIAALIIYFGHIELPDIFYTSVGFVGNITTPLSMIIIGASMGSVVLADLKREKGVWAMLPIRLILLPVIVWFALHLFIQDPTLISICTVGAGMPVASLVAMGSAPYPNQNFTASIGVAVSTICSLITIPIMIVILQQIS